MGQCPCHLCYSLAEPASVARFCQEEQAARAVDHEALQQAQLHLDTAVEQRDAAHQVRLRWAASKQEPCSSCCIAGTQRPRDSIEQVRLVNVSEGGNMHLS